MIIYILESDTLSSVNCHIPIIGEGAGTAFTEIGTAADPALIRHAAPLGWEHISLTGDSIWGTRDYFIDDRLLPLRMRISLLAA